ncbi:hypothetical protein L7F22_051251 [Adiantum nelumboides]|nr:hypothetical protein [Adiantum nelumboides]
MDCFLTALRVHPSSKKSVSETQNTSCGSFVSSSMFFSQEGCGATSHLKRQRVVEFVMRFYVCGMKETMGGNTEFLFGVEMQSGKEQSRKCKKGKEALEWWEGGGKKRRKLGSEEWVAGEGNGNLLCRAPARLKRLMRRVRAKVRKMGLVQEAASFHYDPLSYSLNFDEGCWQHCEAHSKVFYTPSLAPNATKPS